MGKVFSGGKKPQHDVKKVKKGVHACTEALLLIPVRLTQRSCSVLAIHGTGHKAFVWNLLNMKNTRAHLSSHQLVNWTNFITGFADPAQEYRLPIRQRCRLRTSDIMSDEYHDRRSISLDGWREWSHFKISPYRISLIYLFIFFKLKMNFIGIVANKNARFRFVFLESLRWIIDYSFFFCFFFRKQFESAKSRRHGIVSYALTRWCLLVNEIFLLYSCSAHADRRGLWRSGRRHDASRDASRNKSAENRR